MSVITAYDKKFPAYIKETKKRSPYEIFCMLRVNGALLTFHEKNSFPKQKIYNSAKSFKS